jgi:hemoglobin-like flavoprotein
MTFREFSRQCEISLRDAVIEILIQPKGALTLGEKMKILANTILAYAEKYEELTGQKAQIQEIVEAIKHD